MTDTIKTIDYVAGEGRGYDLIPSFLKDDQNIETFLKSFMSEIQELYNLAKLYSENSTINSDYDFILNQHGERVNLARGQGQSNDSYRLDILSHFKIITSYGSATQMIDLTKVLLNANSVTYDLTGLRTLVLSAIVDSVSVSDLDIIRTKLEQASPSGMNLILTLSLQDQSFLFSENSDNSVLNNRGFSSLSDGSDGGQMDTFF